MKKIAAGLMVSATVLGLALTGTLNVHAADTTDATNDATLQVEAGSLSMTKPAAVAFDQANVEAVYTEGYDKTAETKAATTVSDFLGTDDAQSVSVKSANGWSNANMNADGAATLTITSTANGKSDTAAPVSSQPSQVATVKAGETTLDLAYALHIEAKTLLHTGKATNTLTWTVGNTPDADQH